MKKTILALLMYGMTANLPVLADTENERTKVSGPYLWYEESFMDNTFGGVSLGGGMRISSYDISNSGIGGQTSLVYGAHIGKWFNPGMGAQISFRKGEVSHFDANYNLLSVDFMFDIPNWTKGVDAGRKFYYVPFVGAGCGFAGKGTQGITFTCGMQGRMKVRKRAELFAELRGDVYGNKLLSQSVNTMNFQMALQVGVSVLFREKTFRKATFNDNDADVTALNERINMLVERVKELEAYNRSVEEGNADDSLEVVSYRVPKQNISGVYIKFGKYSSYLEENERAVVRKIGLWLKESKDRKIKIVPFSDNVTDMEYSSQLSKKRIDEILSILYGFEGVDSSRIKILSPEDVGYEDRTDSSVMIIYES